MKKLMKIVAIVACAAILVAGSVAGTFAWLAMKTESITNTFTAGDIEITLEETKGTQGNSVNNRSFKMVPGQTIEKDPTVTVEANSEACWLFVKIEESTNFDDYLTYAMAAGWTELNGVSGVYYREVDESNSKQEFEVIKDNLLTANKDATKAMYDTLGKESGDPVPTLTVTAYAIQKVGFATAAAAWEEVSTLANP